MELDTRVVFLDCSLKLGENEKNCLISNGSRNFDVDFVHFRAEK